MAGTFLNGISGVSHWEGTSELSPKCQKSFPFVDKDAFIS